MDQRRIRIGIDVGGTFTHAVAVDSISFEVIGQAKVPTTHTAEEGVAKGIIESLELLLSESHPCFRRDDVIPAKAGIAPNEVAFIAHSTTQATNALLEGDIAPVGILGMGKGLEKLRAKSETQVGDIELAPGRFLKTYHRFLDTAEPPKKETIKNLINELLKDGAKVIVAAEAFSVDDTTNEALVLEGASELGIPATASSEISQLYGLKVRTRTAVINASMLPKMVETANMTESSVRKAGITAPLMIMRSDGGVMNIIQMRKRPILTMLSGPAAGVAAALMYAKISDGIFLEVGGTSTDISAIQNGRALIKTAEVGGHRVYLRTLDVRTIGLAGGSMCRVKHNRIEDVGPRSAHIAGLGYSAFTNLAELDPAALKYIQPKSGDPSDYVYIEGKKGTRVAITPTCAANLAGYVPKGDYAEGDLAAINRAVSILAKELKINEAQVAEDILSKSAAKCIRVVGRLLQEYKLDKQLVALIGGGGGAAAVVPYTAKHMQMQYQLTKNAAVISAIGVALAMVRDTIERTVINPTSADILTIRQDVEDAVLKMGAAADSIEVQVEVDAQKNILRATATGTTELRTRDLKERELLESARQNIAAQSMQVGVKMVLRIAGTHYLDVFGAPVIKKRILGLYKQKLLPLRVLDKEGVIRLQMSNGAAVQTSKGKLNNSLQKFLEEHTSYGDAGRTLPDTFILYGSRILDLTGLLEVSQIISLANAELANMAPDDPVVCVVTLR
ncbi:MAG: hydantoinase/oxoprolinase family protein [bacterium]|nr:hydantoinase/oxoprolinase family protein [bacterium]